MLVNHNIIDYMVKSCVDTYNLGEARLIKQKFGRKEGAVCIQTCRFKIKC